MVLRRITNKSIVQILPAHLGVTDGISFMFVIEDQNHAEPQGQYASLDEALSELRRRQDIPWNKTPNVAPCQSWETCGRDYEIIEYDDSGSPWHEIRRYSGLKISASGVKWEFEKG
jgi:hypothetical protein